MAADLLRVKAYESEIKAYIGAKSSDIGKWTQQFPGRGKTKACFATIAERTTRFYIVIKIPDRTSETMADAIIRELSKVPQGAVKTITCDRGSEFACWRKIEQELHCDMYFADPYCAWQKGTNENLNGLLREFYPKGRNLSRVSETTLQKNRAYKRQTKKGFILRFAARFILFFFI